MLILSLDLISEIFSHARASDPAECCGLVGGSSQARVMRIYPLQNVAPAPLISYEAAPEELFAAQRLMRERGEELLAIYHSHPRSAEPSPSDTDVRLAYYPETIYLIVGLGADKPVLRAFHISEKEHRWDEVEYEISGE
ncbi:MAG: M67 family metallopeptidase [Acidobacteriota bacterium]|nr:M67 family metallopeptidase [Acidobacteriota bacterium]